MSFCVFTKAHLIHLAKPLCKESVAFLFLHDVNNPNYDDC